MARRPGERPSTARSAASILIIDDHQLIATPLGRILCAEGFPTHVCRARDIAGIRAEAAALTPGLALLDLDLGRDHGGNLVDGVRLVAPLAAAGWRSLILSAGGDPVRIGAALDAGAIAWVPQNVPFASLLAAVHNALAGRDIMPRERRDRFIGIYRMRSAEQRELAAKLDRLTHREREVLGELAAGHRAQAVADGSVVSLATVRTQIRAVLTKLEVRSQLEAVALYRLASRR